MFLPHLGGFGSWVRVRGPHEPPPGAARTRPQTVGNLTLRAQGGHPNLRGTAAGGILPCHIIVPAAHLPAWAHNKPMKTQYV